MEAARRNRDDNRLPTLSLGLSSVRLIVNKLEAEYARVAADTSRDLVIYNPNVYDDSSLGVPRDTVWSRFLANLGFALRRCVPGVTFGNFALLAIVFGLFAPRMISYLVLYPFCRLVFGTLYPAYASYKAVRTKNLKEYVKWMMYWIVFALFTCTETFTDVFLSWFPFYYEVKIVLVLWLLSPATKGSSILYRKFVHPALCRREQEIDEYIAKAKDQGYHTVLNLGTKGVNYATTVIMQTAIKNFNLPSPDAQAIRGRDATDGYQDPYDELDYRHAGDRNLPGIVEIVELDSDDNPELDGDGDNDPDFEPSSARSRGNVVRKRKVAKDKEKRPRSKSRGRRTRSQTAVQRESNEVKGGGGLVQQIRKSYSLSDLTECEVRDGPAPDEASDVLAEPRLIRRAVKSSGYNTRRSASESNSRSPMYFPEVDVDVRAQRTRTDEPDFSHIKSSEDISSGYSSADNSASLTRTASAGAAARARARGARPAVTAIKRPPAAEDEVIIEELPDDDTFEYANMPPLVKLPPNLFISDTDPPFIYQLIGDQVKIIQVLGNPISANYSQNNFLDQRDQNEINDKTEIKIIKDSTDEVFECALNDNVTKDELAVSTKTETKGDSKVACIDSFTEIQPKVTDEIKDLSADIKDEKSIEIKEKVEINNSKEEKADTTSLDASVYENDSVESDDEASFGTPDDSPRSKRKSKSPKGKYGKGKAPAPPKIDKIEDHSGQIISDEMTQSMSNTSLESLSDILNTLPNTPFKDTGANHGFIVNPISEKKRRQKSKSPGRIPKGSSSGISKLLQLPTKLAFWKDDKSKADTGSNSSKSESHSRRSSTNDQPIDDIYANINTFKDIKDEKEIADDQISFKDCADFENESISQEIKEKSDALQKLIDAKIESHPEYKFVSLHDEIATTSKSTDV